jgi:hypothetical protein
VPGCDLRDLAQAADGLAPLRQAGHGAMVRERPTSAAT